MGIRAWWRRKFGKDVPTFTSDEIVQAYVTAGIEFGDVVSMIYMGECIGFDELFEKWEDAEKAYAGLGYRTLSIDDFISAGGYGTDIDPLLRVPRKEGETVVFHAAYYREHFLHRNMMVSVTPVEGGSGAFTGQYIRPSTAHLTEK
jgi:hypothetical protein